MTQPDFSRREDRGLCTGVASDAYTAEIASESDIPPSTRVVETVSEATDTDLADLRPLYDAIDPDALDRLIGSPRQFTRGCIRFRYEGCTVTVDAAGWIAVSSETDDGE